MERVGGIIIVKIDGQQVRAKGGFTYDLGVPKNDAVVGSDGVHGFKSMPKPAYLEGEITDSKTTDVKALMSITNSTVTLEAANGKVIVFYQATYTGDGTIGTEEGNIKFRVDAVSAREI